MAIQIAEEHHGKLAIVSMMGQITKADYEQFMPEIERVISKHGKIDILLHLHDFHGWSAGALWEDIKFDLKHFNHVRYLAIVGETKWEKWMASFCRPFTTAKIKYFDHQKLEQAMTWIRMQSVEPVRPPEHPAVFGIYADRSKAELAVELLKLNEFKSTEISVLLPHLNDRRDTVEVPATQALQGAEIGGGAGAVAGGMLGWLSGIGLLAVPGAGAIFVAGPIGAIVFAATTGAGVGALLGALSGMGVDTEKAEHFSGRLHKGDILLSVHCAEPNRLMRAKELLVETGAEDVYSARHPQAAGHR